MSFGQTTAPKPPQQAPVFSWSSPNTAGRQSAAPPTSSILQPLQPTSRSITPDVSMTSFPTLQPTNNAVSNPWGAPTPSLSSMNNQRMASNPTLPTMSSFRNPMQNQNLPLQAQPSTNTSGFSIPPPPSNPWRSPMASPTVPPPSGTFQSMQQSQYGGGLGNNAAFGSTMPALTPSTNQQQPKQGLDKYQSLL